MVSQQLVDEVTLLPAEDRLELMERLQASFESEASDVLSDEQKADLRQRLDALKHDPLLGEPWEVVERRMRERMA